jgi:hypothetical protein
MALRTAVSVVLTTGVAVSTLFVLGYEASLETLSPYDVS